ncbi:hypothetical protein AMTRI_Chr13g125610 [Amborella trichopoda]
MKTQTIIYTKPVAPRHQCQKQGSHRTTLQGPKSKSSLQTQPSRVCNIHRKLYKLAIMAGFLRTRHHATRFLEKLNTLRLQFSSKAATILKRIKIRWTQPSLGLGLTTVGLGRTKQVQRKNKKKMRENTRPNWAGLAVLGPEDSLAPSLNCKGKVRLHFMAQS